MEKSIDLGKLQNELHKAEQRLADTKRNGTVVFRAYQTAQMKNIEAGKRIIDAEKAVDHARKSVVEAAYSLTNNS